MFARVPTVRDTEAEVKVKILQEAVLKIMPLNHSEIGNRSIANCELHTERV